MSRASDRGPKPRVSRAPFVLFVTILVLAVAQIGWWVVVLVGDVRPGGVPADAEARERRIVMVATEGVAFACAMGVGAWLIYRSLRREEQLRRDEANFLAAVTHELKSPLASLRLHAESLELRSEDAARVKTYASRMRADVDRLERLVENLLTAARAEAGALDIRPQAVDFSGELAEIAAAWSPILEARGLTLQCRLEPGVRGEADLAALRSVVENLLDNAMKYSAAPSTVELRLRREAGRAVVEVSDQGVGLDSGEVERVFERFYRAGDERVRTAKGTGLGLYLVSEIVRAHGGTAMVDSAGRGRGATFRTTWPLPSDSGNTVP